MFLLIQMCNFKGTCIYFQNYNVQFCSLHTTTKDLLGHNLSIKQDKRHGQIIFFFHVQ